ncbi:hypothetical protein [Haliea atlantica]
MIKKLKTSVITSVGSLLLVAGLPVKADLVEELSDTSAIPKGLLLLKYHPDTIPEKQVLSLAGQQIGKDWRANEYSKDDHVYMFRKDQVAERPTKFTGRKVAPEYREKLMEYASSLPDELYLEEISRLDYRMYKDGKLQYEEQHAGGTGKIGAVDKMSFISENEKLKYPPLGSYEILMSGIPQLHGSLPSALPETIQRLETIRGVRGHLALDRKPIIPAIEMDAETAEALWRKPDCNPVGIAYIADMPRDEAEAKAEECRKKLEKYGEAEIRTIYHLAISDVVLVDRNWIVKAKVKSVEVHGPGQRLLRRYSASDLPLAEDSWEKQKAAQMLEEEKKLAELDRAAAEAKAGDRALKKFLDNQRDLLAAADITGLHLGMNIDEAESVIQNNMEVKWQVKNTSANRMGRKSFLFDPFSEYLGYIRADGKEQVTLFVYKDQSQRIYGIARMVLFPDSVSDEEVTAQLLDKYGSPAYDGHHLIWTADFGHIDRTHFAFKNIDDRKTAYRNGSCRVDVFGGLFRYIQRIDGSEISIDERRGIRTSPPMIRVNSGKTQSSGEPYDSDKWARCGPTVVAEIRDSPQVGWKQLTIGLLDLSEYAEAYRTRIQKKQRKNDSSIPAI